VVLGRIAADQLVGGEMHIDADRALRAVGSVVEAAAIVRVANSNMERAIRAVSVERGEDPREFPLVAFGGGGGLHACEIAEELGVRTVIVPAMAGALSALGMLLADRVRDYSAGVLGSGEYEKHFRRLEERARKDVRGAVLERFADVRYAGQSYELTIPFNGDFHREHQRVYGYSDPKRPTQMVTLRVRATVSVKRPSLPNAARAGKGNLGTRRVWIAGRWRNIPAGPRESLGKRPLRGPALITDYGSTTLVPMGWSIRAGAAGSLILERK
jgi:N-methylhydantoinase A